MGIGICPKISVWFGISDTTVRSPLLRIIRDALLIGFPEIRYRKVYASKVTLWNLGVYFRGEMFHGTDPSEQQCGELR